MDAREIDNHPDGATDHITLRTGEAVTLRPLRTEDAGILGAYFLGLSPTTRSFYGPHRFDQATADELCASVDSADALRMLACSEAGGETRVIGYFISVMGIKESDTKRFMDLGITLDAENDCTLAPSVADDYQDAGLGSLIMAHVLSVLRKCGKRRLLLMGGVQERNARAAHFYVKHGFQKVGEFKINTTVDGEAVQINNFDMILDL